MHLFVAAGFGHAPGPSMRDAPGFPGYGPPGGHAFMEPRGDPVPAGRGRGFAIGRGRGLQGNDSMKTLQICCLTSRQITLSTPMLQICLQGLNNIMLCLHRASSSSWY